MWIEGPGAGERCVGFYASRIVWGDCVEDMNCDGTVDFSDINPFIQVLTDQTDYQETYPGCWPSNADIDGDGSVDFGDINPFVALLTGGP